jgi:hypothetical protein
MKIRHIVQYDQKALSDEFLIVSNQNLDHLFLRSRAAAL